MTYTHEHIKERPCARCGYIYLYVSGMEDDKPCPRCKERQKQKLIEIMQADEKDGLYDTPDKYCVTRPDGECISEDPRCMHNTQPSAPKEETP